MRSLDCYYFSSFVLVLLCFGILGLQKLSPTIPQVKQILIVGCNLEAAALAYRLQETIANVNVTILEENECGRDTSFTFIHDSPFAKKLVDSINFKYKRVPEKMGFWDGKELLVQKDTAAYVRLFKYGLSQWALAYMENKFKNRLSSLSAQHYQSIEQLFQLLDIIPNEKSLEFLLYDLGLDREYVRTIVYPYLYAYYFQQMDLNLLAVHLKLLELFNPHYEVIGTESDMIFRLTHKINILEGESVKEIKWDPGYQQNQTMSKGFYNVTTSRNNFTNINAIVFCNSSKDSNIYYYFNEIEGQLNPKYYSSEDPLPQSIYSSDNIRLVKKSCIKCRRSSQQKKFILFSRQRLNERDLSKMFKTHEMINSTRKKINKYLEPELGRFMSENGIFHVNHVYTVSDSRELSLSVVENVAYLVKSYLLL